MKKQRGAYDNGVEESAWFFRFSPRIKFGEIRDVLDVAVNLNTRFFVKVEFVIFRVTWYVKEFVERNTLFGV